MMDPQTRGWPNGMPRENYYSSVNNGPFHILQPPGYVVFFYEIHHEFRIVPLDHRPHPGKDIKLWEGDSRGRWEGNTLVIEGRNFNEHAWYDTYGNFHSADLRIEERFTFVGNRLYYDVTSYDPKVFMQPWNAHVEFRKNTEGVDEPW